MPNINLENEDWDRVMHIIGNAGPFPWVMTNPLLMKIGEQRRQSDAAQDRVQQGNGQEQYPRDDQVGLSSAPGVRGGHEQRAEKPARRT